VTLDRATIRGRTFTITTSNNRPERLHPVSLVDGEPITDRFWITHGN